MIQKGRYFNRIEDQVSVLELVFRVTPINDTEKRNFINSLQLNHSFLLISADRFQLVFEY